MTETSAISVVPVTEAAQFHSCLQLRFQVYRALGFIDHDAGLDLDPFDWSSYHFLAQDEYGSLAATVRLVIPVSDSVQVVRELQQVEMWCSQIRDEIRLDVARSKSLPILETMHENALRISELDARSPAELSRIIVAPPFRGRGVSRALVNAVVEKARQLDRDVLFLQCLPSFVRFFEKFGFESVARALRYGHLIVPSDVVAMKRRL